MAAEVAAWMVALATVEDVARASVAVEVELAKDVGEALGG